MEIKLVEAFAPLSPAPPKPLRTAAKPPRRCRSPEAPADGRLVQAHAVQGEIVHGGAQSVGVEAAVAIHRRRDTRRHKNQRFGIASVGRKVLDITMFQRDAFRPFAGKSLRGGRDLHAGARGRHLEFHPKRLPVADLQRQRVDLGFVETGLFRRERIIARLQEIEDGKAAVPGIRLGHRAPVQIRERHFGAGHHCGTGIENRNSQRRRLLRESGGAAKKHG